MEKAIIEQCNQDTCKNDLLKNSLYSLLLK